MENRCDDIVIYSFSDNIFMLINIHPINTIQKRHMNNDDTDGQSGRRNCLILRKWVYSLALTVCPFIYCSSSFSSSYNYYY